MIIIIHRIIIPSYTFIFDFKINLHKSLNMKILLNLFAFCYFTHAILAQAPQKFSYQCVILNGSNQLITNQQVGIRVSILQGSSLGSAVYSEIHTPITNANGLATLEIGGGAVITGVFSDIDWANGPYFVKSELDLLGGNNYTIIGIQQLLSVPYSLYSANGVPSGSTHGQVLTNCNGVITWALGGLCPGEISGLDCEAITNEGVLYAGQSANSVTSTIVYSLGGGGSYANQSINSTGVSGLVATLEAGNLSSGPGNLTFTITGTPASSGIANFTVNFGNQSCTISRTVYGYVGAIDCNEISVNPPLVQGIQSIASTGILPYYDGIFGSYDFQSINSTGVTGLTLQIIPDNIQNGDGGAYFSIYGTPSSGGIASFEINFGGQNCSLNIFVNSASTISATCGAINVHNPDQTYGSLTDQEGNVYKTIIIGSQEWMAENLKTSTFRNGDPIANEADGNLWVGLLTGAWCYYNNDSQFDCPYGKLYNWFAVTDSRNLCPSGWHVPTEAEWGTLTSFLGDDFFDNGKLKSTGFQYWLSPNQQASNESGFSGLPGGRRYFNGSFNFIGSDGSWWSSNDIESGNISAPCFTLSYGVSNSLSNAEKIDGLSVRCLRD